jgi:hypothetical protein
MSGSPMPIEMQKSVASFCAVVKVSKLKEKS